MPTMTVTNPTAQLIGAQPAQSQAAGFMDKNDFLRLLVVKLANQNPFEPMKDEDFIAQMAQFTQLEQLTNMNDLLAESLTQNSLLSQSIVNTMATQLIGRTVSVETSDIVLGSSGGVDIRFDLAGAAADVTIEIVDESGSLVRALRPGAHPSGESTISWDGKMASGERATPGRYRLRIKAENADGESVPVRSYFSGVVDGVRYVNGAALLSVGDALIPMANVIAVSTTEDDG